jgi:hypothetical protein
LLIVPGLMPATRTPLQNAIGTSLVGITALGLPLPQATRPRGLLAGLPASSLLAALLVVYSAQKPTPF